MSNNFVKAIQFTLEHEVGLDRKGNLRADGGYTNDPRDPGGETKWGISKKAHPALDIKNLTLDEAFTIYKKEYYDAYSIVKLDDLEVALAVAIFDSGVNCGIGKASRWYSQSKDARDPVNALLCLRKAYYTALKSYPTYGKGWLKRVVELSKYCSILQNDSSALT